MLGTALNSYDHVQSSSETIRIALLTPILSTVERNLMDTPFVTVYIPSLVNTLEEGFEYVVYLGADVGDRLFDDKQTKEDLHYIFDILTDGYDVSLVIINFEGMKNAPAWVWSSLALQAFHDGCDYFYQVNDDLMFVTPGWSTLFVSKLQSSTVYPNLGMLLSSQR